MSYYVYIASNQWHSVIYTGVTNNIYRRMDEHRNKKRKGFTKRYNVNKLLFVEEFSNINDEALTAEKKIKGWTRVKKFKLIRSINPKLNDLWDSSLRSE
ncbi:MAG: GIY-YIG nuclease family protein [Candidatus Doudnabacteria bacterium]|nr:GIY-YIG nuclease family protein [Candidatus Doudnabacteria bacterium]